MGLGNGNPKSGDKGSNFNYELKVLQLLDAIATAVETGGGQEEYIYIKGTIDSSTEATLVKLNETVTLESGIDYDVYKLKGIIYLEGGNTIYANLPGIVAGSTKLIQLTTQNQLVAANVSIFNRVSTPYGKDCFATDDLSGNLLPVVGFVIFDNQVTTADEWFITFLTTGSANFSGSIYIDMDFGIPVGTTVTFIN